MPVSGRGRVTVAGVFEAVPPYVRVGLRINWSDGTSTELVHKASGPSRREFLAVAMTAMSLELPVSVEAASKTAGSEITALTVDLS